MKKQSIPVQVALRFRHLGHDVVSVSLSASCSLVPYDSACLLDHIMDLVLPDGFVRNRLYDDSLIVYGSCDVVATPLSCCSSDTFELPISMVVELPDGCLHDVTFDLKKGDGLRNDYIRGGDRFVRFTGTLSVDDLDCGDDASEA